MKRTKPKRAASKMAPFPVKKSKRKNRPRSRRRPDAVIHQGVLSSQELYEC
jgi:hypothetical protein